MTAKMNRGSGRAVLTSKLLLLVGRVTPCAPSWRGRNASVPDCGGQGTARPTYVVDSDTTSRIHSGIGFGSENKRIA